VSGWIGRYRALPCVSIVVFVLAGGQLAGIRWQSPPAESYYMVVFGAQDEQSNPLTSHCFATFIKLKRPETGLGQPTIELKHINWFTSKGHECGVPHGLLIDGQLAKPEPGENRDTACALRGAARHGLTVYKYGPFEIDAHLYERAQRQIDLLEGRVPDHRVLYKQIDFGLREGKEIVALNCIHAVSDIVREPAPLSTGLAFGREAAELDLNHLKHWIKDPSRVHRQVWERVWPTLWENESPPTVALVECAASSEWDSRLGPQEIHYADAPASSSSHF